MWIVKTSSANMPQSCRGTYRRVAMIEVNPYAGTTAHAVMPQRIDIRDKAVKRIIDMGKHSVGRTPRAAYQRTLAEAERRVAELNSAQPMATEDLLVTWGGSA